MRISWYLIKCVELRVEKEISQALEKHQQDPMSKSANPAERDAWQKEHQALEADVPNYRQLRTQQLQDWIKSVPEDPPDEMFS